MTLFTPPPAPFAGLIDYRELLERGTPRVYLVPFAPWQAITECLFRQATGEGEERPIVYYYDLLRSLTAACEQNGHDRRRAPRQGGDVPGVQGGLSAVRRRDAGAEPARLQLGAAGPAGPRA